MYIYMYTYMYIHIYVHTYTHIFIFPKGGKDKKRMAYVGEN